MILVIVSTLYITLSWLLLLAYHQIIAIVSLVNVLVREAVVFGLCVDLVEDLPL